MHTSDLPKCMSGRPTRPAPSRADAGTRQRVRRAATDRWHHRSGQRRQWDQLAPDLQLWWPTFERVMDPVTRAMIAHAELPPGALVVDVACGFGEPALSVAQHLGSSGHVVATDLSASMLAVARERAWDRAMGNVAYLQMDAEEPTVGEERFDAVMCRLGLMFLPHLDAALRRLSALLVEGGRFVAGVWSWPEANAWLTVAQEALGEFTGAAGPPGGSGPFGLADPRQLTGALEQAGLVRVDAEAVPLRPSWPSPAAYAAFHRNSPMGRLVAELSPAVREQAWAAVAAAARRRWGAGPLHLHGEVLVVSGAQAGVSPVPRHGQSG